ncbi:protein of unknown function DUF6 transmembrane [Gloeothece citriformis PCC 7424]|uniref:EamA domain-containing protein n=1 Tax=Gloeothece citriformis (strain PCC 7424) TaxID=65393 RepID=B7KD68_GLOC7|nr:DMT family transporter [Gloeothece citriformis]ACK73189.1 protein of unknown function DUF6 transmembrane [Gloeothece citriformis PCC 7424]
MTKIATPPQTWKVTTILSIGVLAVSTAAIFIRLCFEAGGVEGVGFSLFISASRLLIASILLLPSWGKLKQTQVEPVAYYYAVGAGCCLGLHFASWTTSLSFTSIAASTTLVTTIPIWVSLLSWVWYREKPTKPVIFGIIIAIMGGILIAVGDTNTGRENSNPLLGDFLALLGAWMTSLYLLLGREAQNRGLTIGNYIVIAYSSAAVFLFPLPFLFETGYLGYPTEVYLYVGLMAILSQLIGHTSLNWAVRWISPTLVTLAILCEPIISSLLGWLIFGEIPSKLVIVGGIILLIGVATATFKTAP